MKKLTIIFVALAIVASVLFFGFSKAMGSAIEAGLETFGPDLTKTSVEVDSVKLSVLNGSASVSGLLIGSPEGYDAEHTFRIDYMKFSMDPMSLLSDKIVIREIVVDGADINYEKAMGPSNLDQILANVEAFVGPGSDPEEPVEESGEPTQKIGIGLVRLANSKVSAYTPLTSGEPLTVPLPEFEITDIGSGDEGVTFADAAKRIIAALNTQSISSIASSGESVGKQLQEAGSDWLKSGGNAFDGVKGLFKKKDEE